MVLDKWPALDLPLLKCKMRNNNPNSARLSLGCKRWWGLGSAQQRSWPHSGTQRLLRAVIINYYIALSTTPQILIRDAVATRCIIMSELVSTGRHWPIMQLSKMCQGSRMTNALHNGNCWTLPISAVAQTLQQLLNSSHKCSSTDITLKGTKRDGGWLWLCALRLQLVSKEWSTRD